MSAVRFRPCPPSINRGTNYIYRVLFANFKFFKTLKGLALIELLIVIIIISIVALILLARYSTIIQEARQQTCQCNKSNINAQVQLYYVKEGQWPSIDLSNIVGNTDYFPDGIPTCPVSYTSYELNPSTYRVTGHVYGDTSHP